MPAINTSNTINISCSRNVYVLLNRDNLLDIESQQIYNNSTNIEISSNEISSNEISSNEISSNEISSNEISSNEITSNQFFTCVICYYDFSNSQSYSCTQCNECKLCLKCTLKIFNKNKCPVCQKPDPWCKKPNGKIVKRNKIAGQRNQEQNYNTIQNRNNYSKCYTILIFVFFIMISYLWLRDKHYKL